MKHTFTNFVGVCEFENFASLRQKIHSMDNEPKHEMYLYIVHNLNFELFTKKNSRNGNGLIENRIVTSNIEISNYSSKQRVSKTSTFSIGNEQKSRESE